MLRAKGWMLVWVVFCGASFNGGSRPAFATEENGEFAKRPGERRAQRNGNRYNQSKSFVLAEMPFVEGQEPPRAGGSEMWCLVTKPPCLQASTRQVTVRPATFYYEGTPAVYETISEEVLLEPEKKAIVTVPAVFKTEKVRTLVKAEAYRLEVTEPEFARSSETVLVKPAYDVEVAIPAQYEMVSEDVETAPEKTVFQTVCADTQDYCYNTCQVPAQRALFHHQQLVAEARVDRRTVPAEYAKRDIYKMVKEPVTRKVVIPAQYEEVSKEVLVTPASHRIETIPAKFQTVTREVMVKPAGQRRVDLPAILETVSYEEMTAPAQLVWQKTAGCPEIASKYNCIPGGDAPLAKR